MSDLTGKVALVTGGSRGIGRAIVLELARRGAAVAFSYASREEAANETVSLVSAIGGRALAVHADSGNAEAVKALFDAVTRELGPVDILVNNAGITKDGLSMTMSEDAFDEVLRVNLKGAFLCAKAAERPMMKKRWGRIINLSSIVGLRGNAGQANYAASKAGLIGLTKTLAKELATRNITVNAVAPGFIDTDMTAVLPEQAKESLLNSIPMKRLGAPEDVARAVAFFASEEAAYVTGQVLCVDGGMAV